MDPSETVTGTLTLTEGLTRRPQRSRSNSGDKERTDETQYPVIAATVVALVFLAMTITPLLAQNGNVWSVAYYANPDWAGQPAMGMQSSYIDFNWGTAPPGPGMPATDWTATMTSAVYYYYSGTYVFQALADDEISVQIDGVTYINTIGAGMSGKTVQVAVPLTRARTTWWCNTGNIPTLPTSISTGRTRTRRRLRLHPVAGAHARCNSGAGAGRRPHRRRPAIPRGPAPVRPRPPASPPSTATTTPASSRTSTSPPASSPMGSGTSPTRGRSRRSHKSRSGATARRAPCSACSSPAARNQCRLCAPRRLRAGSTTVLARRSR